MKSSSAFCLEEVALHTRTKKSKANRASRASAALARGRCLPVGSKPGVEAGGCVSTLENPGGAQGTAYRRFSMCLFGLDDLL